MTRARDQTRRPVAEVVPRTGPARTTQQRYRARFGITDGPTPIAARYGLTGRGVPDAEATWYMCRRALAGPGTAERPIMTRTTELGWGAVDVVPDHAQQDRDADAQLFAAYLEADTRDARMSITRQLARCGYLAGVKVA